MDFLSKLRTIAADADLETAEEIGVARPVAACGFAEGRQQVSREAGLRRSSAENRTRREQAVAAIAKQTLADRGLRGHALERKAHALGIRDAVMPGGRHAPLLKTMLTSVCERNCYYCPFRSGRDYRRATFQPDEMAALFDRMVQAGLVQGLFLSSGVVAGGISTQDKLIDTAELLRHKYDYRGYLHLKVMPGAERDQVFRAMQLADRVSINLEAPNGARLAKLSPTKRYLAELLQPLRWAEEIRQTRPAHLAFNGRWPSTVTQFVVGAAGESDLELLQTTQSLVQQLHLARTYFSRFSPISDTPMENVPAAEPLREHRLYQAFFLFRDYGFDLEEMPFGPAGNLPLDEDPKLAWAREHLLHHPVELNTATRRQLLRVPGIGPKSAGAILRARRQGTLCSLRDVRAAGVSARRAAEFVLLNGHRPARQLRLF